MSLKDFDNNSEPQFCVIAPTAYLEEYATQSPTHLVLAHIVDTNPTYANFYREMSERGDRIIMDNGAFEGQLIDTDKLVELGHICGADAIVLPDYPGKKSAFTINAARNLITSLKDEGFKTMFVPQSEIGDLEDWITAYDWAATDNPDIDIIGMSILGMPNALPHIPKSYARVVLTQILIDRGIFNFDKYHHYLGLNAGPALEIPPLIEMGALNSCDSSGPVWCGINGISYAVVSESYMPMKKQYLREVDFDWKWDKKLQIHEVIQYNLDLTFDLFKQ